MILTCHYSSTVARARSTVAARASGDRVDCVFNELDTEPTWPASASSVLNHRMVTVITKLAFAEGKPSWVELP
jgi:hypothetical protein